MACDICGKTHVQLNSLLSIYQTTDVSDVCQTCEDSINKQLRKVRKVTHNILTDAMNRFISNLKRNKN